MPRKAGWGEKDLFLERDLAAASLALCDRAESLFLPEATHWAHLEEPAKINAALIRFFAGDPAGGDEKPLPRTSMHEADQPRRRAEAIAGS